MSRMFAMPNKETFSIKPIADFVARYCAGKSVIVDPFSRDSKVATITNDINEDTSAQYHMDAVDFMTMLVDKGVKADVVLCDPPYSPRQISECYKALGRECSITDTQNANLMARMRRKVEQITHSGSVVLTFGWNSNGLMNEGGSWATREVMLIRHGGAHNDTICLAQERIQGSLFSEIHRLEAERET